jgi:protein ImuB
MLWLCILLPPLAPEALETLALWAMQWSSQVSPGTPTDGGTVLWLEIGASRRLFGDHAALCARLAAELASLGHAHRLGVAPTPQGAALLARAGIAAGALTRAQLLRQLEPLPLALLALPSEQLAALHGSGLRRIGELLALPAASVARRFGPDASLYLRRLCGAAPEPLRCLQPPARFDSRCEFQDAVTDTTALLFPLQRLLAALQGYLRARDRAVQRYTLRLEHRHPAVTRLVIGLARPSRDAAQLLSLARERLATTVLAADVHGLGVEAHELVEPALLQGELFACAALQSEQLRQVIDRLAARLGTNAVQHLGSVEEHRPERAWRMRAAQAAAPAAPSTPPATPRGNATRASPPAAAAPARPCWLLPEPQPIDMPRELLAGPERIESGWWDGADVARDYYLARGAHGARLWVFRDLRSGAWCVHGLWA